eukprot:3817382-Pyramimonas_sp.AAC.1
MDSEVLISVSLKNLVRDDILAWRPANDVAMASGDKGRIPVSSLDQPIRVNHTKEIRVRDRVGKAWVNSAHVDTQRGNRPRLHFATTDCYEDPCDPAT